MVKKTNNRKVMNIFPYCVNTNSYSNRVRTDIHCFTEYDKFKNPFRNSRYYYWNIHKLVDCDVSIFHHYGYALNVPVETVVKEWLGDNDIVTFKHPVRKCVYAEIRAVKGRLKAQNSPQEELDILAKQEIHYRDTGVPENMGNMSETSILIRRHNSITKQFNEAMWAHLCTWSYRDQISFPVILREFPELRIKFIEPDVRRNKYCTRSR